MKPVEKGKWHTLLYKIFVALFRIHEICLVSVLVIYALILSGCSEGFKGTKQLSPISKNGTNLTGGTTGGTSTGTTTGGTSSGGTSGGGTTSGGTTSGGSSGSSGWGANCNDNDAINLNATIYSSPQDIQSWSQATRITHLEFRGDGVAIDFDKEDGADRWPDYTIPGWDGALQYTIWLMMCKNGQWYAAGMMQYWYGLAVHGGDITENGNQIAINWVYSSRWGEMQGHQPAPGEKIAFFVSAGNARDETGVTSRRERSNVVVVPMPSAPGPSYNY
jgi:hypothetical protein